MAESSEDFISLNGQLSSNSNSLDRRFVDLIYWRNVRKSAAVFASGIIVLTSLACFSFISVVSYLALSTLAVTFALRIYARVTRASANQDSPLAFLVVESTRDTPTISELQVRVWLDKLLPILNGIIACIHRAFLVTDYTETVKVAIVLYLLTHIGACFNLLTLLFIGFIGLFSFPRLYELYRPQMDFAFTHLEQLSGQLIKQVREKNRRDAKEESAVTQ